MSHKIDFDEVTEGGRFNSLSGHEFGVRVRDRFNIDELDRAEGPVRVIVPDSLYSIAPSFFQGMFAPSVEKFGTPEAFFAHYEFEADPVAMRQILRGLNACLNRRDAFAA